MAPQQYIAVQNITHLVCYFDKRRNSKIFTFQLIVGYKFSFSKILIQLRFRFAAKQRNSILYTIYRIRF